MYHLDVRDDKVKTICKKAYPTWKGRRVRVNFTSTVNMSSSWQGGSRSYFKIVRLNDNKNLTMPAQSMYDPQIEGIKSFEIPQGFVVIENSIYRGKDMGLIIHARSDGSNLLPESSQDITENEIMVLRATRGLKSQYAGDRDCRKTDCIRKGMTSDEVDNTRAALIEKGMMSKNKAINNKGRNAIEGL